MPSEPCPSGFVRVGDDCQPVDGGRCPAGTLAGEDGICRMAGLSADQCAEGFEHDGDASCLPVLPPAPCGPGTIALPGDTACAEVAPCGEGRWGDIAVDGVTIFVDAGYTSDDGDGSIDKPFSGMVQALEAASDGDVIAIAEGVYTGDLFIDKSVHLIGRCPGLVELRGTPTNVFSMLVTTGAAGAVVERVAVTGPDAGIIVSDALDVVLRKVWIHDTGNRGINIEDSIGPASIVVEGSLVEKVSEVGILANGLPATIRNTVVRDVATTPIGTLGVGILGQPDATFGTVATVDLDRVLIRRTHSAGLVADGSSVTATRTVVIDVSPEADGLRGHGIESRADSLNDLVAELTFHDGFVERSHAVGVFVAGALLDLRRTTVRDVLMDPTNPIARGMSLQPGFDAQAKWQGKALVEHVTIDRSQEMGTVFAVAEAELRGVLIRGTAPLGNGSYGRGVNVQGEPAGRRADVAMIGCRVTGNHEVGVLVTGGDLRLEGTLIDDNRPSPLGLFGDGLIAVSAAGEAKVTIFDSIVRDHPRAGVANFGSQIALSSSTLACNAVDLTGEAFRVLGFDFDDQGDNRCGCPAEQACKSVSVGLEAPMP